MDLETAEELVDILNELCDEKTDQLVRFDERRFEFSGRVQEIEAAVNKDAVKNFVVPYWREKIEAMRRDFDSLPLNFLHHPVMRKEMFVYGVEGWFILQREWVFEHATPGVLDLLKEDPVGVPILRDVEWRTSHQMIHTLSHLLRWEASTGLNLFEVGDPKQPLTVVEWGGGYGTMAKLLWRLAKLHGRDLLLIEIDLSFMAALQEAYLSSVLDDARVEVILPDEFAHNLWKPMEEGPGIYLAPLGSNLVVPKTDLFISTWALSESTSKAQQFIAETLSWFGAKHLLLAYQDPNELFPRSQAFVDHLPEAAAEEPLKWGPEGNFYRFL